MGLPVKKREMVMRSLRLCIGFILAGTIVTGFAYRFNQASNSLFLAKDVAGLPTTTKSYKSDSETAVRPADEAAEGYRLDASQSKFIAHAIRGGLLWFKGHDHLIAVREFTGEARLDPGSVGNSSLQITAK